MMAQRVLFVTLTRFPSVAILPEILANAGCEIHVLSPLDTPLARNRVVKSCIETPLVRGEFMATLRQQVESGYDWVILGDDYTIYTLIDWAVKHPEDRDWVYALLPGKTDRQQIQMLASKIGFLKVASDLGLPIARSVGCTEAGHIRGAVAEISYPVMLKNNRGFGSRGVFYCGDAVELEQRLTEPDLVVYPAVVQSHFRGDAATTAALFDQGSLVAWFSFLTPRIDNYLLRPPTEARFFDFPPMEACLRRLGEYSGYHGFGGVDFIVCPETGEFVLLEMHLRPIAHYWAGKYVGVDFADATRRMLAGESTSFQARQKPAITDWFKVYSPLAEILNPAELSDIGI